MTRRPILTLILCLWALARAENSAGADIAAGMALAQRWCSGCHATDATQGGTDAAPAWVTVAMDPAKDADHLRALLTAPHGQMQHLSLSQRQIEDLVAYIRSLTFE